MRGGSISSIGPGEFLDGSTPVCGPSTRRIKVVVAFSEIYSVLFAFSLVLDGRTWEEDLEVIGVLFATGDR